MEIIVWIGAALIARLGSRVGNVAGLALALGCLALSASGTVLVATAATAFVVADAVGAPSATVLLDAASNLRETEARRLEEAGGRAAVMLVLPLGLCFLPAFVATSVVPILLVLLGESLR